MKAKIFLLNIFFSLTAYSQAAIEINTSSCTGSTGLIEIVSGTFYDGYQWYSRPLNSSAPFLPIPGATQESFIFDWATYNQTEIVVWCIFNEPGSYFSNSIEVDIQDCFLGVRDHTSKSKYINLFPNPADNLLSILSGDSIEEIEIINSLGQKVLKQENTSNNSQIDVSDLESGIYILSARFRDGKATIKFVKS